MVQQQFTDKVINALRKLPKQGQANVPPRPSVKAMNQVKKILLDYEMCRLPYPTVSARRDGVRLIWNSPLRNVSVDISQKGEINFETSLKRLDEDGDIISEINSDGPIEGPKSLDRMMAWFLEDIAVKA
jgi:hypothetical protein